MRFVSWNCCAGLAHDLAALRDLSTDVAVLSEVASEPPPSSLLEEAPAWSWVGEIPSRGLAIAGFSDAPAPRPAVAESGRWSIAAELSSGIGVLGLWTCPSEGRSYGQEATATIDAHTSWLADTPSIVAGDWNLAPNALEDGRTGVLKDLFARLDELGYVSLYHHTTGEAYGEESQHTYFHQWKQEQPFHIDYCFLHRDLLDQVKDFTVGTFEQWTGRPGDPVRHSDHVPLILDLDT